ncbi:MAG: c-type cytochrome [Arcobacteraceae bacterium]
MLKKSLYLACTASLLAASTTMCYKKEHLDPSTIETIALDGGVCAGEKSVGDMKKNGYIIESLKLQNETSGMSYIYVFKKQNEIKKEVVTSGITDEQLTARLEAISKKKEIKKVEEETVSSLENGENIYTSTCKSCHGDGSIRAYSTARPLNDLSLEDMEISMRDYANGSKDNGMAILMTPYVNLVTNEDLKSIYTYLQTLK